MFSIARRLGATFAFSALASLKAEINQAAGQRFKIVSLLEQVHAVEFDFETTREYMEIMSSLDVGDLASINESVKEDMIRCLLGAYQKDIGDAFTLIAQVYSVDETAWLRECIRDTIYKEGYEVPVLDVRLFIDMWPHTVSQEMADALERHSDLAYVLSNNTFSFSGKSFIQILNYTYLIKQRKVYDSRFLQSLSKIFHNVNYKELQTSDLVLLAHLCDYWIQHIGFSRNLEALCIKLDYYLSLMGPRLTTLERVLLLQSLQIIGAPSKFQHVFAPLVENPDIPKAHFAVVANSLLQYEDCELIINQILNRMSVLVSLYEITTVLLALVQCERYPPEIFQPLLARAAKKYEGVFDVVKNFDDVGLMNSCRLYQIIITMRLAGEYAQYECLNIPIQQLETIYMKRIRMMNTADISHHEETLNEIFESLLNEDFDGWRLFKIERQVKVSLFSVDFQLILQRQHEFKSVLVDVLGGSLFVHKRGLSRKCQWRIRLLRMEGRNVRFINLSEWNQVPKERRRDVVKAMIVNEK